MLLYSVFSDFPTMCKDVLSDVKVHEQLEHGDGLGRGDRKDWAGGIPPHPPPPSPPPSLGEAGRPGPKAAAFPQAFLQESRFSRESSGTAHSSHLFINYPSLGIILSLGIKLNKSQPQVSQVLITVGEAVATGAKYVLAVFSHFCTKSRED